MYFAYNSANTQCITTFTTGVMFTKQHLPQHLIAERYPSNATNLDSSFNQLSVMIEESSGQTPYLVMGNTKESPEHFTNHKGPHTSYIEFMFINS